MTTDETLLEIRNKIVASSQSLHDQGGRETYSALIDSIQERCRHSDSVPLPYNFYRMFELLEIYYLRSLEEYYLKGYNNGARDMARQWAEAEAENEDKPLEDNK